MPLDLLILLAVPLIHVKPAVMVLRRPSSLVLRGRVITPCSYSKYLGSIRPPAEPSRSPASAHVQMHYLY